MKLITRFLYLSAAGIMLLTSCAKEQTESYDKFENQALEAWMTQNRRELLKNYQPEGGYYVEILAAGNPDAKPVNDTACWVKFDFSGRDLSGNIVLTRRANEARQHAIQKCARHCARGKAFRYIIPARRHVIVFKHKVCMAFIQNAQFHARHGRGRHRPQIPCLTALLSACTACFLPKKAGAQRTVGHIKPGAGQMFQRRARLPLCFGAKHRRAADTLMHGQRVLCAV